MKKHNYLLASIICWLLIYPSINAQLFDQMNTEGSQAVNSQLYGVPLEDLSVFAADDFEVPLGDNWAINAVEVGGFYSPDGFTANNVNVIIYGSDAGGNLDDGDIACSNLGLTPSTDNNGSFFLELDDICDLSAGTYWISVYVDTEDETDFWNWNWSTSSSSNGAGFAYQNPNGGNPGTSCTDWTSDAVANCDLFGVSTDEPDLAFALYAELNCDLANLALSASCIDNLSFSVEVSFTGTDTYDISDGEGNILEGVDAGTYDFGPYSSASQIEFTVTEISSEACTLSNTLIGPVCTCNNSEPEYDDCGSAFEITSLDEVLPIFFNACNNGDENADNPDCFDDIALSHTLWVSFEGDGNTYNIQSFQCGAGSLQNSDTQLQLYEGNCNGLIAIACNEDQSSSNSYAQISLFPTENGVTYYLLIDSYSDNTGGEFCLSFDEAIPILNNGCGDAQQVFACDEDGDGDGVADGVNVGLTNVGANGFGDPDQSCANLEDDTQNGVWYYFVATAESMTITTQCANPGSLSDSQMTLYDSCGGDEIACNDDANGYTFAEISTDELTVGDTYYIMIDGSDGATGTFCLQIFENDFTYECTTGDIEYLDQDGNPIENGAQLCPEDIVSLSATNADSNDPCANNFGVMWFYYTSPPTPGLPPLADTTNTAGIVISNSNGDPVFNNGNIDFSQSGLNPGNYCLVPVINPDTTAILNPFSVSPLCTGIDNNNVVCVTFLDNSSLACLDCEAAFGELSGPSDTVLCSGESVSGFSIDGGNTDEHTNLMVLTDQDLVIQGISSDGNFDLVGLDSGDYCVHAFNYLTEDEETILNAIELGVTEAIDVINAIDSEAFCAALDLECLTITILDEISVEPITYECETDADGNNTGTIIINDLVITGGTGTYEIDPNPTDVEAENGDEIELTITDEEGCSTTASVMINIDCPPPGDPCIDNPINIDYNLVCDTTFLGNNTGEAIFTFEASGGNGDLTITAFLNDLEEIESGATVSFEDEIIISVTDQESCEVSDTIMVDCAPNTCEFDDPLVDLEWLADEAANLDICNCEIQMLLFEGEYVFILPDNSDLCDDFFTIAYDCDGNEICFEGGIAGLTECSDLGVLDQEETETILDQCNPCGDNPIGFVSIPETCNDELSVDLGEPEFTGGNGDINYTIEPAGPYDLGQEVSINVTDSALCDTTFLYTIMLDCIDPCDANPISIDYNLACDTTFLGNNTGEAIFTFEASGGNGDLILEAYLNDSEQIESGATVSFEDELIILVTDTAGCTVGDTIAVDCAPSVCEFDDPLVDLEWLQEVAANLGTCNCEIQMLLFEGEYVFIVPDNPTFCSDFFTTAYDCEGNIICNEGGEAGLTECSDLGILDQEETETILDQCNPDPCAENPISNIDYNIQCLTDDNGYENGTAVVNIIGSSGGNGAVDITIDGTGSIFNDGDAFIITAIDDEDCSVSISDTIVCPPSPCFLNPIEDITLSYECVTDDLGVNTGQAVLSIVVNGGNGVFTYTDANEEPIEDGQLVDTGLEITVTATDEEGCSTLSESISIVCDTDPCTQNPISLSVTQICNTPNGLGDGTGYLDIVAEGGNGELIIVSDPADETLTSGTEYSVTVTDEADCEVVVTGTIDCPQEECVTQAGSMSAETIYICDNILDGNAAYNDDAILSENDIVNFILHTSADNTIGDILGTNSAPYFPLSLLEEADYNTVYYLSPIAGIDDGSGNVDLNHPCTVIAAGSPVVYLEPIEILSVPFCESVFDNPIDPVLVTFTVVGGYPAFDPTASYTVSGTGLSEMSFELDQIMNLGPFAQDAAYSISASDDIGCSISEEEEEGFSCIIPLSVEWLDFSGRVLANANELNWSTANEHNNAGFQLERSLDGANFETITFINGHDSSSATNHYQYLDETSSSSNYYRLAQIDHDGTISYSDIILLDRDENNNLMINDIFPIPATNSIQVNINSTIDQDLTLHIYDTAGRNIYQTVYTSQSTSEQLDIDISALSSGVYLLLVEDGQSLKSKRFIKQ